ncbi:MAG TPA: ATP phosphoribosyltransferase [Trueperaceae bacterium]
MKPSLTLALPKGRVLEESLTRLRAAGIALELSADPRALRHHADEFAVIEMRNADVPVYVELGVADAGIVGKDVLLEAGSDLYEPVDLGFAACRLSLIRPSGESGTIRRVATKYPRVTATYLERLGSSAEVVRLSGNVELACLTGLADAVVDVVETGATLRANGLAEVDVILESSARFVVNRAALKLKGERLRPLIDRLRAVREGSGG